MDEGYYQELNNAIISRAEAMGIFQDEAFFELATETLVEMGELTEANYTQFRKTGIQVDGYAGNLNDEEGVIKLILLDYSSSQDKPEVLTNSDIQAITRRGTNFIVKVLTKNFINEIEESSDVFKLANLILNQWNNILKIKLILITNRQMSVRVKPGGIKLEEVQDTPITLNIWDFKRFSDINAQGNEREPLIIKMSEFSKDICVLPIDIKSGRFPMYLAVVPGSILADIYDIYSTRLLEQNVRVYLQAKGKINRGIQNTILDEPEMFFSYNNGLTATAESLTIEEYAGGKRIKEIHNFQIVNGGQTMASIYQMSEHCKKKWKRGTKPDISDVYVQMKLSVISPESTMEIVPKISRFSNSQNAVSDADFFSNHPYHVAMEKFSRKVIAPSTEGRWSTTKWYYERMRGQYNNDKSLNKTEVRKREFENQYPSTQKFTKTDLAKYLTPWEGKPEVAQRGAAKCFHEFASTISGKWEKNSAFCNEMYYRECIAKAIIYKSLEKAIPAQPWYETGGGFRAPIILHTIGKLSHDLEKLNRVFPFQLVWNKQALPDTIGTVLNNLTSFVADVILCPMIQGQLATEWAKQQECTNVLAKKEFEYPQAFLDLMDKKSDYHEDARDAIKDQKLTRSAESQIFAVTQDGKFWEKMIEWGKSREIMNSKDISIVSVAKNGKIPTEKQCEYIFEVYERCRDAGFRVKPREELCE